MVSTLLILVTSWKHDGFYIANVSNQLKQDVVYIGNVSNHWKQDGFYIV